MPPVTGPMPVPPDTLRNKLMGAIQPLGGPTGLPGGMPLPPTLNSGAVGGGMTGNMPLPPQAVGGGAPLPPQGTGGLSPNPLGGPSMPPVNMPPSSVGGYGGASLPFQRVPTPLGGPMAVGIPQSPPNPGRGMYTITAGQGPARLNPGSFSSQSMGITPPPNRQFGWGRRGHI